MDKVRIDKWLWAARFYKTRKLSSVAVSAGHVQVAGQRVKPAFLISKGSTVRIKKDIYEFDIIINELTDKRGPASVARTLYTETAESMQRREVILAERKLNITVPAPDKRPDKRARGKIIRFQRQT